MIVKWVIKAIAAVNANNRPEEVAAAAALGIVLAMIPSANLLWVCLLALTFFLKINFGMEMVVIAVLKPFSFLLDPVFDAAGFAVLTARPLEPFFTGIYNMPVVPFTAFNNTVVAGSFLIMGAAFYPLFLGLNRLLKIYREKVRDRLMSSPVIKKAASLPLVSQAVSLFRKASAFRNQ